MCIYFLFHGAITPTRPDPPHYRVFAIKFIHTTFRRTLLAERSARRRDLYLRTHKKTTDYHVPGGIRNRNPNKRAAADPLLRPRSPFDQLIPIPYYTFTYFYGISYKDNIISRTDTRDIKGEACIDLYIISAFVFTFKVLF